MILLVHWPISACAHSLQTVSPHPTTITTTRVNNNKQKQEWTTTTTTRVNCNNSNNKQQQEIERHDKNGFSETLLDKKPYMKGTVFVVHCMYSVNKNTPTFHNTSDVLWKKGNQVVYSLKAAIQLELITLTISWRDVVNTWPCTKLIVAQHMTAQQVTTRNTEMWQCHVFSRVHGLAQPWATSALAHVTHYPILVWTFSSSLEVLGSTYELFIRQVSQDGLSTSTTAPGWMIPRTTYTYTWPDKWPPS